jgi:hypothetical protein
MDLGRPVLSNQKTWESYLTWDVSLRNEKLVQRTILSKQMFVRSRRALSPNKTQNIAEQRQDRSCDRAAGPEGRVDGFAKVRKLRTLHVVALVDWDNSSGSVV